MKLCLLIAGCTSAVMVFTSIENHCLEMAHDHLFVRPCNIIPEQNFEYNDETQTLCVVNTGECLIYDSVELPLRFMMLAKNHHSSQIFELVAAIGKGTLIKTKQQHFCASIIDLIHPLHLKICDSFDAMQIFSFAGQIGPYRPKNARPNVVRMYTS